MNNDGNAGLQDEKQAKMIEEALNRALASYFPSIASRTMTARAEFYDKYKREADEYDKDFIKKYDEDLNTTLIFAGLFSAVTSAFIIDFQQDIKEDFAQTSAKLLRVLVQNANATAFGEHVDPPPLNWQLSDTSYISVQCTMYASLAVSVLAACLAMLGKQWLNRYDQIEMRGTLIQRSRHRHRKMTGMATWHFDIMMEALPVMLQIALLLFCYGLSRYLWNINQTVAAVIIGTSSLGFIFYVCIVSAATASYECPYQTPVSLLLRVLVYYDVRKVGWYQRCARMFKSFRSWVRDRHRGSSGPMIRFDPRRLGRVSSVKTWFVSERKKPTDPEASTAASPTKNTNGLVRKTTSISSFHSALSELGSGPGPSRATENFALSQLNQGTAAKPVSEIPTSPMDTVPTRTIIQTVFVDSMTMPLFTKGDLDWEGFVLDSRLLDWMWSISTDTEHVIAVLRFIPEIIWHSGVGKLPSINVLYESILSSFDFTKKPRVLIQSFKDRALAATKALVHLKIQRKCLTGEDVEKRKENKLDKGPRLASPATFIPAEEGDLESALGVLDYIEGRADFVRWESYKLTSAHHQWLAHILLYRCWDERRNELGIDGVLSSFIKYSFDPERDASWSVMTDCLFMVYLQMGLPMHPDDLYIMDKSREFGAVMERIYARLGSLLEPAPPHELPSIDNILNIASTIKLMRPLANTQSLDQLFNLFIVSRRLVLDEGIKDAGVQELNEATMRLARSALRAAWTHPTQTPSVRSLPDSLKFLVTHFDLLLRGEAHYETIEAILWSLDSATAPREMSEGYFIPELDEEIDQVAVSPVFVKGFCALFDPSVPFRTRKAACLVFPLLTQSWFGRWTESVSDTGSITWEQRKAPVMVNQEMGQFCRNWAATVNQNPVDRDNNAIILLSTLLWMMSSSQWLKCIPDLQYQLLRYHTQLPWNSPMLAAAFKSPTLIPDLISLNKREGLKLWTTICWIHEQDLGQTQKDQLEKVSRKHVGLAENKESFKAITEAQERIEVDLRLYEKEPGNGEAKKLRARKEGMDRSKGRLRQVAPQLGAIA